MRWADKIVADRQNGKIVVGIVEPDEDIVGLVVVGCASTGWWMTSS